MLRSRAVIATVGLCVLVLTGLPPPSSSSEEHPPTPDQSSDIQERGLGGVRRPEAAPFSKMLEVAPTPQSGPHRPEHFGEWMRARSYWARSDRSEEPRRGERRSLLHAGQFVQQTGARANRRAATGRRVRPSNCGRLPTTRALCRHWPHRRRP